jgi:hypothetical protein
MYARALGGSIDAVQMGNEASRTKVLQDLRHPALVHTPIESGLLRRYDPLRRLDTRWTAAYAGARHRNSEVRRSPLGGDNVATFEMKSSVEQRDLKASGYDPVTLFSQSGEKGELLSKMDVVRGNIAQRVALPTRGQAKPSHSTLTQVLVLRPKRNVGYCAARCWWMM